MAQARELLGRQPAEGTEDPLSVTTHILSDALRPASTLQIPDGQSFSQPDHESFTWDIPLDADELIGLLGTLSWVITMPEDSRQLVFTEARRLLRELLGIEGEVTVDVAFRSDCWRSRLTTG